MTLAEHAVASFDRITPMLQAGALASPQIAELRAATALAQLQVWPGEAAVVLTEIADFPLSQGRILTGRTYGDPHEAAALLPGIEAWARVIGCTRTEFLPGVDVGDQEETA